jgi:hypothetical protein
VGKVLSTITVVVVRSVTCRRYKTFKLSTDDDFAVRLLSYTTMLQNARQVRLRGLLWR